MNKTDNFDISNQIWEELASRNFPAYLKWGAYFNRNDVIKFDVLCREFNPSFVEEQYMCCVPKNYPDITGFCFEMFKE